MSVHPKNITLITSPTMPRPHTSHVSATSAKGVEDIEGTIDMDLRQGVAIEHNRKLSVLFIVLGDYLPNARFFSAFSAPESGQLSRLSATVANDCEMSIVLQLARELGVIRDSIEVRVDRSISPSSNYFLTKSVIAAIRADSTGILAVNIALCMLQRTVLDASVELWDVDALCASLPTAVRSAEPLDGVSCENAPRIEVRVAVCAEQLATADAVVQTIRAALPKECLCISAVVRTTHNLTGPMPPLSAGASVRLRRLSQPATHPDFSPKFSAVISAADAGVIAASTGPDGAGSSLSPPLAMATSGAGVSAVTYVLPLPPGAVEIPVAYKEGSASRENVAGRMTAGAYMRINGLVGIVSAGHGLSGDLTACLQTPDTPLKLLAFVNPPSGLTSGAPTSFTVALSSDAVPHAARILDTAPAEQAVRVLSEMFADVSLFVLARQATAEEDDLVPASVLSRQQAVQESTGPHPILGLVAYDDAKGAVLFTGSTMPGVHRRLNIVGIVVKRLPIFLPAGGTSAASVTRMVTYLSTADEDGAPSMGDSGGACFRPGGCTAEGFLSQLVAFICSECASGGTRGAPRRVYYELTPAALALAQLRAALSVLGVPGAASLEFMQPRPLQAALAAAVAGGPGVEGGIGLSESKDLMTVL